MAPETARINQQCSPTAHYWRLKHKLYPRSRRRPYRVVASPQLPAYFFRLPPAPPAPSASTPTPALTPTWRRMVGRPPLSLAWSADVWSAAT
eukprot:298332-Chlamydomonas_euryale.AAC.2